MTDRRTDGCPGTNNMSPDPEGGDINIQAIVMLLVHDTPSQCALQMYEVFVKIALRLLSYRGDTIL